MRTRRAGFAVCASALALLVAPATAGMSNSGDGSAYNNPDLVDDPALGCDKCEPNIPAEPYDPLYDLDWSLGLRGGITDDGTGERTYELIALPSVTLKHETIRGGYDIGLSGEVSHTLDGDPRLDAVATTAGGTYQLDAVTRLEGRINISASQDDPNGSDYDANVVAAPLVLSGDTEASLTRDLGPFEATLKASAGRTTYGETVYDDDSTADNSYQNTTSYGAGSRLGFRLTPGLSAFIDAQALVEQYDEASPSLLVKLDNITYAVRGGLSGKVGETLDLQGSLGLGYRDFGDDTLGDFSAVLYDVSATFRPDETLVLTGSFTTAISSPGSTAGATAKVEYEASGEVSYLVNPWLRLRADAQWSATHYQGIDREETGWGFGAGADYLLNEHTDVTADYSFTRTVQSPDPASDEHQVTVGVKFHR